METALPSKCRDWSMTRLSEYFEWNVSSEKKTHGSLNSQDVPVRHKKKSGHITITCVLFLTVLQLDVRHQSLQQQPREPLWRLKMGFCLLPSCTHYAHLAIPCQKGKIISKASSKLWWQKTPRPKQHFYVFIQPYAAVTAASDKCCNFGTMDDGQCAIIWHLCLCCTIHKADGANRQHMQNRQHRNSEYSDIRYF